MYHILVVDDEKLMRTYLADNIPRFTDRFQVSGVAGDGLEAIELLRRQHFDVVITDIKMPEVDGLSLAKYIADNYPGIIVIIISGYDDFEYAQQAIQYNIISYMLKPLTVKGLGDELRVIRQKIDTQFAMFRQASPQNNGQNLQTSQLMSLVLDAYAGLDGRVDIRALQCGLLGDGNDKPCYIVMVSTLLNEDGSIDTPASFAASVDRLANKYLRSASFLASGKVVSVLLGEPLDFEEHLYILADEIPQMADRVLGRRCRIGVSRMASTLNALNDAYREAMEALCQGDKDQSGAQFVGDLEPAVKGGELLCRRALETLSQHYMDAGLSLVSLSEMLNVSPNHLSACIKKYAGETFINTLIRKRMEAARELLATSNLKIREIAERRGHTDQHYFSYCFKRFCGESPNSMRRRLDGERAGEEL